MYVCMYACMYVCMYVCMILLLKSDKQLPIEQFEAAVSQSTVPSPLLELRRDGRHHNKRNNQPNTTNNNSTNQ